MRSPPVTSKLQRLAAQAAHDPERVFTTLAYRHTSKSSAPGTDGVTAQRYAEHLEENLRDVHKRLRSGRYQAAPVERVWNEKDDGGQRPIGKPAVRDRMVQAAMKLVIEAILEADFRECAYGFRPKRSAQDTISEVQAQITWGYRNVIDADVQARFASFPHHGIIAAVLRRMRDPWMVRLLRPCADRTSACTRRLITTLVRSP